MHSTTIPLGVQTAPVIQGLGSMNTMVRCASQGRCADSQRFTLHRGLQAHPIRPLIPLPLRRPSACCYGALTLLAGACSGRKG